LLSTEVDALWGGGAHRKIVTQAFVILGNDFPELASKFNETVYSFPFMAYVSSKNHVIDWAVRTDSLIDGETDGPSFAGHFYGPGGTNYFNSTNFLFNKRVTAGHRFNDHFWKAKEQYALGDKSEAYKRLGMSIHYLCDLNNPHHAANKIFGDSWHASYEDWVNKVIGGMLETTAMLDNSMSDNSYVYMTKKNVSFFDRSDAFSESARRHIDACDKTYYNEFSNNHPSFDSSDAYEPTEEMVKRTQRAVAGLLYRFLSETGQL